MPERWLTFDCYGTLIDWNRGIGEAMLALWPGADAGRLLGHHHAVEPRVELQGELPYREVLRRCLMATAAIEGLPLESAQENALGDSLPAWPPFGEVPAALRELRERGWRLAILSNTDPELLAASVAKIGVEFDLTITAGEIGSYKPAHGHWREFASRSGADPATHIHVAASLFHDIAPAAELGLRAVWINRLGESSELPRAAERSDLSGLAGALESLAGG